MRRGAGWMRRLPSLGKALTGVRPMSDGFYHGTTVCSVRRNGEVALAADGQITLGSQVVKPSTRKVRKLEGGAIAGFAGATADAMTLCEALEQRLEEKPGQLLRAAVELAKSWRTEKALRNLDAVLVVADEQVSLQVTGQGDVIEPEDGVIAVGSGGPYAIAAARALDELPSLSAADACRKAMAIAADSCVYTNHSVTLESLSNAKPPAKARESTAVEPSVSASTT